MEKEVTKQFDDTQKGLIFKRKLFQRSTTVGVQIPKEAVVYLDLDTDTTMNISPFTTKDGKKCVVMWKHDEGYIKGETPEEVTSEETIVDDDNF